MKDLLSKEHYCCKNIIDEKQYLTPPSLDNPLYGPPPIFTQKSWSPFYSF